MGNQISHCHRRRDRIYTLKSTFDRVKYTIKDREFLFSFVVEEDTEEDLMEQEEDLDVDGATVSSCYKIKAELYSPIPGIKLEGLLPTIPMNVFAEGNFEPLPKKFVKEIVASFTISPDKETLVIAKTLISLSESYLINAKVALFSMKIYKLTIIEGNITKIEEKIIQTCNMLVCCTPERKVFLRFISAQFKFEAEFSIGLLTSNTEKLFVSTDSNGLKIKFNNEVIEQDNEILRLVEEFHQSIKDLLVNFKSIEIPAFSLSQLKMNLICYFPVIRVVSTSLYVEINFVWLQKVKAEKERSDGLEVNSESFLLDFSKKFCVQSITFYLGNTRFDLLLLLSLNKEVLENGNYSLTLDYKFDPFGISFAKKEKEIIKLDLYNIVTNQLNVETVINSYVLGDSTSLGKTICFLVK